MKQYKVLWFDDNHETLESIKDDAKGNDIVLIGFTNAEDGIKELELNLLFYDAVIVDGLFYRTSKQTGDTVDDSALFNVARFLDKAEDKKKMPWFILSGQTSFLNETNRIAQEYKANRVYSKNFDADFEQLWKDIKKAADEQEDTQIRHEYKQVFDVCTPDYIGKEAQKNLLEILKSVRNPNNNFNDELYFTQIRIIIESMFRAANKFGLLHNACIANGKVNLTESSLFLAGLETKYLKVKCAITHFPKLIADAVQSILFITGAASHTIDPDMKNNINLMDYRKVINSPYLLYCLTFQLMDVLVWFKEYVDEHSNIEENKTHWIEMKIADSITNEWIEGIVIKIADNGWGTFLPNSDLAQISIPPKMLSDIKLIENDKVKVKTKLVDVIEKKYHITEIEKI